MRPLIYLLALASLGAWSAVHANLSPPDSAPTADAPPAGSAPASTATPAPPADSAHPAAAAPPAVPALDPREKLLLSMGYKAQTRNGEKEYRRNQPVTGSRTSTVRHCGTLSQLIGESQQAREFTENNEKPSGASVTPAQYGGH
jgi:hypothetical protein